MEKRYICLIILISHKLTPVHWTVSNSSHRKWNVGCAELKAPSHLNRRQHSTTVECLLTSMLLGKGRPQLSL